jgi:crotonobetainyl-CoA:carnitine CoA-transferase CaiB-like acyl-CoA transferase
MTDPVTHELRPLDGAHVVNTGVNLPADAAAARLHLLGARVSKVEPPDGDPMSHAAPGLYAELTAGQPVSRLDLKLAEGRDALDSLLRSADLLLTSNRPSALERMGLGREAVTARHPRLLQVAIVGHAAPHQELPGHDLTYAAPHGLLAPPALPRTLLADLGGAERAVTIAVALLYARERDAGQPRHAEVALQASAAFFALPYRHGVTAEGGFLGGGDPYYGLYPTSEGWIAIAALEPKFRIRLAEALGSEPGSEAFAQTLQARTAVEWEQWAQERDIPLAAVVR